MRVDQDEIIRALAHIAFADPRKLFEPMPVDPITPEMFYNACRGGDGRLKPWQDFSEAEQKAWKRAAEKASRANRLGLRLKAPHDLDPETAAAVQYLRITRKGFAVRTYSKIPSFALLMRHLGIDQLTRSSKPHASSAKATKINEEMIARTEEMITRARARQNGAVSA